MSGGAISLDEAIKSNRLDDFIAQAEADGVAAADAELERRGKKTKKRRYNSKQFFIVFSPDGETPPVIVHPTHAGALHGAWAMANKYPGQTFFVMASASFPCTASADTRPEGGDATEIAAPFAGGAVPRASEADAHDQ